MLVAPRQFSSQQSSLIERAVEEERNSCLPAIMKKIMGIFLLFLGLLSLITCIGSPALLPYMAFPFEATPLFLAFAAHLAAIALVAGYVLYQDARDMEMLAHRIKLGLMFS